MGGRGRVRTLVVQLVVTPLAILSMLLTCSGSDDFFGGKVRPVFAKLCQWMG